MKQSPNPINRKNNIFFQIIQAPKRRKIEKIRSRIVELNEIAMTLVGDNDSYYANRKEVWQLIDKLEEVR